MIVYRLASLLLVGMMACTAAGARAATRLELVIDEPRPTRSVPWPVTTGVPFPRGSLASADQCRLVDDLGQEQALQVQVSATWDAQRSSIRWLTIDFIARPGRKYALEFGADVRRANRPDLLKVVVGESIRVTAGPLEAEFSRLGPSALAGVRIDMNEDGRIADDEVVLAGAAAGDHVYHDQHDREFTSQRDGRSRRIEVEATGPVRACIRVDGFYAGPDGEQIVAYRTRYHFFAGLGVVKLVDEFRVIASTRNSRFQSVALQFELPLSVAGRRVTVDGWPAGGEQRRSLDWRSETRSIGLIQETYRHFGNPECRGYLLETDARGGKSIHAEVEHTGPWLQVVDRRAAVTGSARWFWQQFPKEWQVSADSLRFYLWSQHGGELDFGEDGLKRFFGAAGHKYLLDWQGTRKPQSPIEDFFYFAGRHALQHDGANGLGINKHHEIWLHFAPASRAEEGVEFGRLGDAQPLCLASGTWNCSTDVFGPLAARPNDSQYEAIVDRVFELERNAQHDFGDYGWSLFGAGPHYSYQWDPELKRHYADPRRFEYHTYQRETQLWWCYLRSGERKFHDWAFPSEDHWVDIAVAHMPTHYSTEWRGGRAESARQHFPAGDWSIDSPMHYVRHHDTAEAWLRGASQFWASYHRTLETTTLAYYLTGDERYNDVIEFWRRYWSELAGKRSDSQDVQPWHREQAWFRGTASPAAAKTWAEMIRDYAPFQSGSRHQMTLWFNLATLYEHTWDPAIRQALREYADAFLDPAHPIGVWRSQDNDLPANADVPMLAHYWSPALWKYSRATGDPRMPDILRRYFTAGLHADPFTEDVGVYSNLQIGYAWYFTQDPRHLRPALHELNRLLPNAEPLDRPEDLGRRIYNPYAPLQSLSAVPRLLAALDDARRRGIEPLPPAPFGLQRAAFAMIKPPGRMLTATLWGFDARPSILGPDGRPAVDATLTTATHKSHLQPFDRTLPGFTVYEHRLTIAPTAPEGWYVVRPQVELGIVDLSGGDGLVVCQGAEPIRLDTGTKWLLRPIERAAELQLESAQASLLRVSRGGRELPGKVAKNVLTVKLDAPADGSQIVIEQRGNRPIWFRVVNLPAETTWLALRDTAVALPGATLTAAAKLPVQPNDAGQMFVPGRFDQALSIARGRELHIPDEIVMADGTSRRLTDSRQGTIEFWVQRRWDERLTTVPRVNFLDNGQQVAWNPWPLPLGQWSHIALTWRPARDDPEQTWVHFYVDGLDQANYRNLHWEGYGDRPPGFGKPREWLRKFIARAPVGVVFAMDDLRISSSPRYADLDIELGGQHTANPIRFTPPDRPAAFDEATLLLLPLDGNLRGQTLGGQFIEAKWVIGEETP